MPKTEAACARLIQDDEAAVGAIDDRASTARDEHRLLDVDAETAELVVRRLHAQHHAGLQRVAARPKPGRLGGIEADAVAGVVPAELRQAGGTHPGHRRLEDGAAMHARPDRVETRLDPGLDRVVRALPARVGLAQDGHARDVAAIALEDAAEVEAHEVAGP